MKVVRFTVREYPDGFAVWRLCESHYQVGRCRWERWCSCEHLEGGPLEAMHSVHRSLPLALEVCELLESEVGGCREVGEVVTFADWDPVIDADDVPW